MNPNTQQEESAEEPVLNATWNREGMEATSDKAREVILRIEERKSNPTL